MRFAYNAIFLVFFCISAPFYFLKMWRRGNWRAGFGQRFGSYGARTKQAVTNRHVVWLHAVSVGEVGVCARLIKALEPRLPNVKFVVSTTTSTGMGELQKQLPNSIEKIYYPLDFRSWVRSAFNTLHPEAIILVEAEIWPNFLWLAADYGLPLFLVNARLSEKSYRGYLRFGRLFRPIFRSFRGVGCQNAEDARRLVDLGFRPERVAPVGSMKFDVAAPKEGRKLDVRALLRRLGVSDQARLLVCGSTHAGEEAILADIYLRLKQRHPGLFLVLVPRHFERTKDVTRALEARNIKFICRTEVETAAVHPPESLDCLVVNTVGELRFFYREAEVVFVGKSLTAEGGQNPIEPAALGKAVVFGPNMQNFTAIAQMFIDRAGAVQVADAGELEREIDRLLMDSQHRATLGKNAKAVVDENAGATEKTVEMIVRQLKTGDLYLAPR